MLVLVVEVLIGFSFQSVFQPGFDRLSPLARNVSLGGFVLLLVALGLLLMVPARHWLVEEGRDTFDFFRFSTRVMAIVLFPFALAIAMEVFVVSERLIGAGTALAVSGGSLFVAVGAWFLIPALRALSSKSEHPSSMNEALPPLKDRITQVLTECRVVLPGTQALLGFQLIAFFTDGFENLTRGQQMTHLVALLAILLGAICLMLPAAYHRIGERGRDSEHLYRISNLCLMSALCTLALGISLDFYVVTQRILDHPTRAAVGAGILFTFFVALWFGWPLWERIRRRA
jgi:hypothetical protein